MPSHGVHSAPALAHMAHTNCDKWRGLSLCADPAQAPTVQQVLPLPSQGTLHGIRNLHLQAQLQDFQHDSVMALIEMEKQKRYILWVLQA